MAQRRMSPEVMKANANRRSTKRSGVVSAAGSAGGGDASQSAPWTASEIENVMSKAAAEAAKDGIADPREVRKKMLAARESFKAERGR